MSHQSQPTRTCQICNKDTLLDDMEWVNDDYGIPWKFVCQQCADIAYMPKGHLVSYRFDPDYAGEALEPF